MRFLLPQWTTCFSASPNSISERISRLNSIGICKLIKEEKWIELEDSPEDNRLLREFLTWEDSDRDDDQRMEKGQFSKAQWIGHSAMTLVAAALGTIAGRILEQRQSAGTPMAPQAE
jgi:hypothetical protein